MQLKIMVLDIIEQAHKIGLNVTNVTSDMGSSNRSTWGHFNIHANSSLQISNYTVHPHAADKHLYFMPDVPHLVKNLKAALCKHVFIYKQHTISISPIVMLAEHDATHDLKLAPKLKLDVLDARHFAKMKVSDAMNVFSNSVAAALKFMVEANLIDSTMKEFPIHFLVC